jgi:hypothetical protein
MEIEKARKLEKYYNNVNKEIIISFGSCMVYELSRIWIPNSKMYLIFRKDTILFVYDKKQVHLFLEESDYFFQFPFRKTFIIQQNDTSCDASFFFNFITWPRNIQESDIKTVLYYLETGKYFLF